MKRVFTRFVVSALVLAAGLALEASAPKFWQSTSQAELLKGEADLVSIDEFGRIVLGPSSRRVHDAAAPFIWCLAPGADGAVFAGTGNDGQVLRIDAQGKASVWFDAPEAEVHALAAGPGGVLFAATSPDGKVYRLDANGASTVVFDPDDKYIWQLALDNAGVLYVAAGGQKGHVYKVPPGAAGTLVHTSSSAHVTALAFDPRGRLVVGTDTPGRIVRLDADGKGFVLLDSPFREIKALRFDANGRLYAAAVNGKPAAPETSGTPGAADAPKTAPVASVSSEITAVTVIDMPVVTGGTTAGPSAASAGTPKGAVYRIDADGVADIVWESRDDIPYDVAPDDASGLIVATGNGGRLYRVSGQPTRATLLTRVPGQQATAMLRVGQTRYVATSNPGRLVTMGTERAAEGTYISEVKDAGAPATWGTLTWRPVAGRTGRVQVYTRSGNTAVPDDGWSPWTGPYERPEGDAVRSPAGRYLQWKVVLGGGAPGDAPPMLAALRVAYVQRNQRPRVTDITIHPPGVVFQRPYPAGEPEIAGLDAALPENRFPVYSMPLGTPVSKGSGPVLGRRLYQKGLQAFVWKAEDANDDRLAYDVHFRVVGDAEWRPLRLNSLDELAVWDTTSVPDGTYVIRVTASDRLSNVPAAVLAGDAESAPFDIDNTPPAIRVVASKPDGDGVLVAFEVEDGLSTVDKVEYALDAGPWQTAFPADGAPDSRRERYEVRVPAGAAGRLVIRASDAMNNVGTAKADR